MNLMKKNPSVQILNQPSPTADQILLRRMQRLERVLISWAGQDAKREAADELDHLAAPILADLGSVTPKVRAAVKAIYRDLGRPWPMLVPRADPNQLELF